MKHPIMNKLICLSAFILFSQTIRAQENLGNVELTVIERYKGKIAESVKIAQNANFVDTLSQKLSMRYEVPSSALQFSFRPKPLKPMLISKQTVSVLPKYHIDLGFGNYGLFTAHLGANSGRSSKYQWGAQWEHNSLQSGVQNTPFENNPFYQSRFQAHIKNFLGKFTLQNKLEARFDGLRYYGFDANEALALNLGEQAENQAYQSYTWSSGYFRTHLLNNKTHFDGVNAEFQHFRDAFGNSENRFWAGQNSQIMLHDQALKLEAHTEIINTTFDSLTQIQRGFYRFGLKPGLKKEWAGLNFLLAAEIGYNGYNETSFKGGSNGFYLLPELRAEYSFVPTYFSAFVQIYSTLNNQSYSRIVSINPFVLPAINQEISSTDHYGLGLKGRIIENLAFSLLGEFKQVDNLLVFYRDPDYNQTGAPGFSAKFDHADLLTFEGELAYTNTLLDLSASLSFTSYSMDSLEAPYHIAPLQAQFAGTYKFHPKMEVGTQLWLVGERRAFSSRLQREAEAILASYADLSLNFGYKYNDYLSAHLHLDNLLGQRYNIWLGYQSVGPQIGLRIAYRF